MYYLINIQDNRLKTELTHLVTAFLCVFASLCDCNQGRGSVKTKAFVNSVTTW